MLFRNELRDELLQLRKEREKEELLLIKERRGREQREYEDRKEREKRKAEREEDEHNKKIKIYEKILSVLEVITICFGKVFINFNSGIFSLINPVSTGLCEVSKELPFHANYEYQIKMCKLIFSGSS